MTMAMAMANLAMAMTMAMTMTMITITIAIVMIMTIAIPRPSTLKKQTSKQTNKKTDVYAFFIPKPNLFGDQSSLVPFNYFVVLSMTLSRILVLIFVYFFFFIKHLKILPFANITHLTTVGKSSAEKTYTESKEVVINILPREPSATRPAI